MKSIAVVSMDIHKRFSRTVSLDREGQVLETQDVAHGDKSWMKGFFEGFPKGTEVVMEATFNWPWIADLAEEVGLEPHLAQAMRAREMAKGMSKTDRRDAVWLGKLRLAGGGVFPEAYRAPAEVRRMRSLFRTRSLLVSIQTKLKNSIHGILLKNGLIIDEVRDLFGVRGLQILQELDLESGARFEMETKLRVLEDVRGHIAELEKILKRELKKDARTELLRSLPGVGPITAYAVMAEVGEIGRFANGRALAAYAGVLPLNRESAGKDFGKRTSPRCNQYLRLALIEAVTAAVRTSPRMKSLHSRVKAKNRTAVGKARVAVARELAELIYLILNRQIRYMETPPPRSGFQSKIIPNRASQAYHNARSSR